MKFWLNNKIFRHFHIVTLAWLSTEWVKETYRSARQMKVDVWPFIWLLLTPLQRLTLFFIKVGTHWSIKSLSWVISMYEGRKSAFSYSDDKISIVWKKTWQRSLNWVSEVEIAEIFKAFYLIRNFRPDEIKVGIDDLLYCFFF